MKTLYILALVSFAALAWAAFAITRHIRGHAGRTPPGGPPPIDDSEAISHRLAKVLRPPAAASPIPSPHENSDTRSADPL